jgi:oligopeptide/dipeptide ABC transporter ATP-binding protein
MSPLLAVEGLCVELGTPRGRSLVLEGIAFELRAGEALALLGESGAGKTLTALAVLGLLPPAARVVAGEVRWRGRDLLALPASERRALCGREIAMSFQEPAGAFNPVLPVGAQVAEGLRHRAGLSRRAARERSLRLLAEVGLPEPEAAARRHPHELSGGEGQRAMLAMALALGPSLLIADEPTSALDAPVRAEILELLVALRARREMALLLVTHDLAVVSALAERTAVLYAGRVVEHGPTLDLFARARHPYTRALLAARTEAQRPRERFRAIPGHAPSPEAWPPGCRFHPRCPRADARCAAEVPALGALDLRAPDAEAACHHPVLAGEGAEA